VRRDESGIKLSLTCWIEATDANTLELRLIWARSGIISNLLFPASDVNSLIDRWQLAIEEGICKEGLNFKKEY
jgi:hypothetical protein